MIAQSSVGMLSPGLMENCPTVDIPEQQLPTSENMIGLLLYCFSVLVINGLVYYYASIRSLSLWRTFSGRFFFYIGSAISRHGTIIEQHYSRRK